MASPGVVPCTNRNEPAIGGNTVGPPWCFFLLLGALTGSFFAAHLPAEEAPTVVQEAPIEPTQAYLTEELRAGLRLPRLEIVLTTENAGLSPDQLRAARQELARLLENAWGQAVDFRIDTESSAASANTPPPEEAAALPSHVTEMALSLHYNALGEWQIRGTSFDKLTEIRQEYPLRVFRNASLIPRYLADAVQRMFMPVVQIGNVHEDRVDGVLLGGEYHTPDPSAQLLRPGDLLRVLLLYYDREGRPITRQSLEWTYLRVTERDRSQVNAQIISAFRSPLPRTRRRVEIFAWRVTTLLSESELRIAMGQTTRRAAPLTEVLISSWESAKPKTQPEDPQPSPMIAVFTDRAGKLIVNTSELEQHLGPGLVKLEVLSDRAVVARIPWLPGSVAHQDIVVPDDSARVRAGLQLEQLKTQLLRAAAKRATLLAALRRLAENPSEIDPQPLFVELTRITDREAFFREITRIRVTATDDLLRLGNRTAARQVEKMCEETRQMVERHLDNDSVEELRQQFPVLNQPPVVN